jgi:hypothetical protein
MKLGHAARTVTIALAGFALGAWLFHTPTTRAGSGFVHVASIPMRGATVSQAPIIGGSDVIGFSCAPTPGGEVTCYVASQ